MNSLPVTDLQDLGVVAQKPSDTAAKELWDKLREKGVELEDALNPRWHNGPPHDKGLFFYINCPKVAELAFNMGFEDIDAPIAFGLTPISDIELFFGPSSRIEVGSLAYAIWLLQKGARIDRSINSFGRSVAHCLARWSGVWVRHYFKAINHARHLPQCHYQPDHWIQDEVFDSERQEEWNEMLEEDRPLIKQLDELMEEFEAQFLRQNLSLTTFLRGYWLKRMRQVRRERAKPLTEDQKQDLRDAGVILGGADPSDSDFSDYLSTEVEDDCESEGEDGDECKDEKCEEEDYPGECEEDSEEDET
ncbi:hypothetical protein FDECE_9445 [Fusarium decemcellulare]|nr:hypothetical protein FDECE_9445 [Fusarium decemcellulare]